MTLLEYLTEQDSAVLSPEVESLPNSTDVVSPISFCVIEIKNFSENNGRKMDLNIFHVDEEHRKKVPQMFGRTEQEADELVQIVKEWIKSQPHLPELMEESKIRNFLIENKFGIEKTKTKIDLYYTIRSLIPEFYQECNPRLPKMKEFMKTIYIGVHPRPIDGVYRVIFTKMKKPDQLVPILFTSQLLNIGEMRLSEDCMVGEIYVVDMLNLTSNDMRKYTPTLLKKLFTVYSVYSLRLKALYLLNSPPYVTMLVSILKAVLKPKIFQRVHVHRDDEIMKEIFNKNDLPRDYGGHGPSLQELTDVFLKKLEQYQGRFDQLDGLRVDESLRPTKLDNDELLGFYGNFKKLNID